VREETGKFTLPEDREARNRVLREFRAAINASAELKAIREDVRTLCRGFPVPGISP
jgi:hypothetical protein